jgi:hypothetical protein
MSNIKRSLLLALLFLSSCGYRWEGDPTCSRTLFIPFATGDEDGTLTAELIRAFASSTQANIVSSEGRYRLDVSVVEHEHERIGFRIDRQVNNGKQQKNILGDEGRRNLLAHVSLYDCENEELIFGPCNVTAFADYDYVDGDSFQDLTFLDSAGVRQTILAYSLGQLEPSESAREAATKPLYQKLSEKIVNLVSARW